MAAPTWIILLIPLLLGITAVVMLIIVCVRLHNRKVVELYDKIGQGDAPDANVKEIERGSKKNSYLQPQESERNA